MSLALHQESAKGEGPHTDAAARLLGPLRGLKKRLVARILAGELVGLVATILVCGLLVVSLDSAFHWRTPLPRWVGSLLVLFAMLAPISLALWRRNWSFSLIGLCERLEEVSPSLRGKLRSAVSIALASKDDPLAGSPRLQSRLLQSATHSLSRIDLASACINRSFRSRFILLVICLLGIGIWAITAPTVMWQAARRLVAPWRVDAWPRLVVLELNAPAKVARGGDVVVVATSKTDQVPAKAVIFMADDHGQFVSQPMRREGQRFVFSISKINQPYWLRVVGGDDDQMRWRRMEVVEPVALTATRLEAIPPAYSKAPSSRVGSEMTVLEGTKLLMEFRASRSIEEAKPTWRGQSLGALKIDSSGRIAKGEITLTSDVSGNPSKLRIDVRDREEAVVVGAWNGSIRVQRDQPPALEWLTPKSPTKVQPQSRLLLEANATDDVGLASFELRRRVVAKESDVVKNTEGWQTEFSAPVEENVKEQKLSHEVDLATLSLTPGEVLEWTLVAKDTKGQMKASEVLRCAVVNVEELRKETDRRLERILEQLIDAARRQREIGAALAKSDASEESRAAKLATARAARFDQYSLIEVFSSKSGGILEAWRGLSHEQQSHQFLGDADQERMDSVSNDLASIALQDLPAVLHELERVQDAPANAGDPPALLSTAEELARKAGDRLDELVDRLTHWRRWSRASQTVEELLSAEQQLQEQTREAAPQSLGKLLEELDEDEKRLLKDLTARQAALAKQLAELPTPPGLESEDWRDARDAADTEMSLAARDLALNKLNQADSHQSQAIDAIQKLAKAGALGADASAKRSETPGESNAISADPRNGPTEAQLKAVIERQTVLHQKTREALEALQKSGANKPALQAELAELAKAQADLAAQVEAWQAKGSAAPMKEEPPRE